VYALNLTHSPEKSEFWDGADPLIIGAGNTGGALRTSTDRHPGVADSIEHDNDSGVTRRASESTQRFLVKNPRSTGGQLSMVYRHKRRRPKDADARDGDR